MAWLDGLAWRMGWADVGSTVVLCEHNSGLTSMAWMARELPLIRPERLFRISRLGCLDTIRHQRYTGELTKPLNCHSPQREFIATRQGITSMPSAWTALVKFALSHGEVYEIFASCNRLLY